MSLISLLHNSFSVFNGLNSISGLFILISIPGTLPSISILGFLTDTFNPWILPLAFNSGFLPLKFTWGIFIFGPFISILVEGKSEGTIIPVIFSFGKLVFIFNLYLFKLISSSTSPPNISFNVRLELFSIFGPFIFISIPGIFPLIFTFGLLIFALTFGIFPFIFSLLIFPLKLN